MFNKLNVIAVNYGRSFQSASLNQPRQSMNMEYNISLSNWALLATQYRHNINYLFKSASNKAGIMYPAKNLLLIKLVSYF